MRIYRVFQYAEKQARVLARIGDMPDPTQWRGVADARDLDTLIGRMRESGLDYWVGGLPRAPDTNAIERHLKRRMMDFFRDLAKLLPRRWHSTRKWLHTGGNLVFLHQVLHEEQPVLPDDLDPVLLEIAAMPIPQRTAAAALSEYQCFSVHTTPWKTWWVDLQARCPPLDRHEYMKLDRLISLVARHLRRIESTSIDPTGDLDEQWRWRNEFAQDLRRSLNGDPFHIGLVAVYGVLKALQFERCRALLISVSRQWQPPDILRGTG